MLRGHALHNVVCSSWQSVHVVAPHIWKQGLYRLHKSQTNHIADLYIPVCVILHLSDGKLHCINNHGLGIREGAVPVKHQQSNIFFHESWNSFQEKSQVHQAKAH